METDQELTKRMLEEILSVAFKIIDGDYWYGDKASDFIIRINKDGIRFSKNDLAFTVPTYKFNKLRNCLLTDKHPDGLGFTVPNNKPIIEHLFAMTTQYKRDQKITTLLNAM